MSFKRCWDEFVTVWLEREVERRVRYETRARRCRQFEWWDPRGWFCWVVNIIRYLWEWVTETFQDTVPLTRCVLCPLLTAADYLFFGHRILTSRTNVRADSVDVIGHKHTAWAFNNSLVATRISYTDSGEGLEFHILDKNLQYRHLDGGDFAPLKRGFDSVPQAISYTDERAPVTHDAPEFDLLAAGGGRILAKEKGKLRFYFATMEHEFLHFMPPDSPGWLPEDFGRYNGSVPGFYSKLDPQYDTGVSDDTLSWWSRQDYNEHPSLTPFTLPWGGSSMKLAKDLGIFPDIMMVRVEPRVWHLIDARPPFGSGDPPAWVQTYDHVTYIPRVELGVCEQTRAQPSVMIYGVLDLGVGHMHRHLHYEDTNGGEMDRMWQWFYSMFNGPIDDAGGFCDGTCNFYILCKIRVRAGLEPSGEFQNAYAVLWMDEQSYFSERWRLLHPDDHRSASLRSWSLVSWLGSWIGALEHRFDRRKYWCPFEAGWRSGRSRFDDHSRLAVARQTVLVTGIDPDQDDEPVLYSINASWGTGDRTWRWREYPCTVSNEEGWPKYPPSESLCFPRSIGIRGDMTIFLMGRNEIETAEGPKYVNGYFYQKYLPADNTEVPHPDRLVEGEMPAEPFPHAWNFITQDEDVYTGNFGLANRFSHFGVYEEVDSRSQFYLVTLLTGDSDQISGVTAGAPWVDRNRGLCIWDASSPFPNRSPSQFNERTYFKLVRREPFGWIAMLWDKRDDELSALKHTPLSFGKVTLSSREGLIKSPADFSTDNAVEIEVSLSKRFKRWTPPVVQMAKVIIEPAPKKVTILFYSRTAHRFDEYESRLAPPIDRETAQGLFDGPSPEPSLDPLSEYREFDDYLASRYASTGDPAFPDPNQPEVSQFQPDVAIWRVTIAGFGPGGDVVQIFSETICDNTGAGFIFHRRAKYLYGYEWSATDSGEDQSLFDEFQEYCSESGSMAHGTSVWFEDITGHKSTAEKTVFREIPT